MCFVYDNDIFNIFIFWKVFEFIVVVGICFVIVSNGIEFIMVLVSVVIKLVVFGFDVVKYIFNLFVLCVKFMVVKLVFCLWCVR